ncbi:PAN3 [Cordylochernes scorpioides]|uniref:PAN3 n=1 Tax=Cordylochernes scorpioides TaxID=51811 RepID=A0ABY6LT92_9ARAC|nr:PAN3 [Cordylochernes scorpioides]
MSWDEVGHGSLGWVAAVRGIQCTRKAAVGVVLCQPPTAPPPTTAENAKYYQVPTEVISTAIGSLALDSTRKCPSEGVCVYLQQESVEGTTYFYPTDDATAAGRLGEESSPSILLPDFDVFPGNPSHIEHMKPKANAPSFFLPDELRMVGFW